jgi:hypothetical protein
VVINGIHYDEAPSSSLTSSQTKTTSGVVVTSTTVVTGFYTATSTPSPTRSAGIVSLQVDTRRFWIALASAIAALCGL